MSGLGILDQAMFKLEEGGLSPVHMCGAMILDAADSPYPVDGQVVADHVAACMQEVPLMRQRLIQDPLKLGDLQLVEDFHFDVRNHITRTTLNAPGGYAELTEALGEFSSRRMDLARPLWSCEVIEGLAAGQIAIVMRMHHAIMDGSGAQSVLGSFWSPVPLPGKQPRAETRQPTPLPTAFSLLSGALQENVRRLYIQAPSFLLGNIRPLARTLSQAMSKRLFTVAKEEKDVALQVVKVTKTSLNIAPISTSRVVAYLELPLAEVKALRRSFDCSINDLALLFNSYALEHYFAGVGETIDFDLVAGMPVDLRSQGDVAVGNRLEFTRVNLQNSVDDIQKRLRAIVEQTTVIKRSTKPYTDAGKKPRGIDYKALGDLVSPLTLDLIVYAMVRFNLMDKKAFINVAIANVPGPQTPLYMAGAKMHSQVAMGPCADSLALNITVSSTADLLVIGYHGCGRAIRDKELFVEGARQAFLSLKSVVRQRRVSSARKARAKKKPSSVNSSRGKERVR